MAKATLTFEDKEDGDTNVTLVFDPPIDMKDDAKASNAQVLALECLQAAKDLGKQDDNSGCNCGADRDPGSCGHHPDCPLKEIEG